MTARTGSLVFFGGTVVLAAVFVRLGIWQVSRLRERQAISRTAATARALPPLTLDNPTEISGLGPAAMTNRRVVVTGRYDHAADIVIRGQSEGGVPGVRIVTPLRLFGSDSTILVQRGYVTSPDARRVDLRQLTEDGVRMVSGLAFALADTGLSGEPLELDGQLTWRRLDLSGLRARLPYPIRSYVVLQTPDSTLPKLPRRDEPPELSNGPHLSYAIQWFGFAVTAVVVGGIIGFRRK